MRDIYEVPAAAIVLTAHQELEKLVGTIHQNQFKPELDRKWAYLVYAGLWWEPLRTDLDAYMEAVNAQVTRDDRAEALQGRGAVVTRSSPNAVYDADLASFAESGGLFSQTASPGFIELWSLQSRMAHRIRERRRGRRDSDAQQARQGGGPFRLPLPARRYRRQIRLGAGARRGRDRDRRLLANRNVPEGWTSAGGLASFVANY